MYQIDQEDPAGLPQLWDEIEQMKAKIQDQSEEIKYLQENAVMLSARIEDVMREACSMNDLRCRDHIVNLRRIIKLESKRTPTRKNDLRLRELEKFLLGKPGKHATFTEIKGHLGIKYNQLSDLIKTLKSSNPHAAEVLRSSNHKKKILVWKQSFQFEAK